MESLGQSGTTIYQKIDLALPGIFDFDFPIFDESHRTDLERKIVMHYFNKEIGLETFELWKLYLNERLNLEMPYYNELYRVEANKFDYLINVSMQRDGNINHSGDAHRGVGFYENRTNSQDSTTNVSGNDVSDSRTDVTTSGNSVTDSDNTNHLAGKLDVDTHDYSNIHSVDSGKDILTVDVTENRTEHGLLKRQGKDSDVTDENSSTHQDGHNVEDNSATHTNGLLSTTINSDFPQATYDKNTDYASLSQQAEENTAANDKVDNDLTTDLNTTLNRGETVTHNIDNTEDNSFSSNGQNNTTNTTDYGRINDVTNNQWGSRNEITDNTTTDTGNTTVNTSGTQQTVSHMTTTTGQDTVGKITGSADARSQTTENSNNKYNRIENYTDYGTNGSKTQLMLEYRNSIINIDKMVIEMLQDLFMGVY